MSTANAYLTVRGIEVDIVYKDIKHLHIGVYPPLGRVRVATLTRLAAYFGDHQPMTIERTPDKAVSQAAVGLMPAHLLHQERVVALITDEHLAMALVALLDSVPRALQTFAETFVDLLRQHTETDDAGTTCRECCQPAPCPTRLLLQDRIGALSIATQRL